MSVRRGTPREIGPGPLGAYLRLVRFSHTVFALPFAAVGALLAARGVPDAWTSAWILVAMVAARSTAMGFNRLVDADLDARNPRTRGREIPSGRIRISTAAGFTAAFAGVFFVACALLNEVALFLSPLALGIVLGYSFTKRFTHLSHFVLGLSLGIAPLGAWVGVLGSRCLEGVGVALVLAAAVVTWVAGFDMIYACLDVRFDRSASLHSMPQRFGVPRALRVSAALHAGTVALLAAVAVLAPSGPFYVVSVGLVGVLLLREHRIVRPDDLSRLNQAFFTLNAIVGLLILAGTVGDLLLAGRVP